MRLPVNARNPETEVWHAFHYSVLCDVPHAVDIFSVLTASAFSFPRYPLFDCSDAELRCYRIVHEAWREGLAAVFFMMLGAWRQNGRLATMACTPEFQQLLLDALRAARERSDDSWTTFVGWWTSTESSVAPEFVRQIITTIRDQVEADRRVSSGARAA